MSVWGKIIGGAAGFAFGGPLGALLGALAGHVADRVHDVAQDIASGGRDPTTSITFTIGVIVLAAKMARVDGAVTADEVAAFRAIFRVTPDEEKNVARVFNLANQDARGFEVYARQIAELLAERPAVLEDLLDSLFVIALADGHIHEAELVFLRAVAEIFGFDAATFARIRESHLGPDLSNPYTILGVTPSVSDAELKAAYRQLIKTHHPDRLIAHGVPSEFVKVATEKLATINAAYDRITAERGAGQMKIEGLD